METQRIIYQENFLETLNPILGAYGLDESPEELMKKLEQDQLTAGEIVMEEVLRLFKNPASKKDSAAMLQERLGMEPEKASALVEELAAKVTPLISVGQAAPDEQELLAPVMPPAAAPISSSPPPSTVSQPKILVNPPTESAPEKPAAQKPADAYRESIE